MAKETYVAIIENCQQKVKQLFQLGGHSCLQKNDKVEVSS